VARGVRAELAGVAVGDGLPVAVMGVVNVSPESFHPGSVYRGEGAVRAAALAMVDAGAALIDVGARSTAPYLDTGIDEALETERLARAVATLTAKLPVPVCADTARAGPARAALEAGARVINDVSTLRDPALPPLVAAHGAGLIVMAAPGLRPVGPLGRGPGPLRVVRRLLAGALRRTARAGIPQSRVVVDPGIGFFREESIPWDVWDVRILAGLGGLQGLGRPICVGVSRKSFIGAIVQRPDPAERLAGSLAATTVAVMHGAAVVRTHDVAATRDAVRVAERLRGRR
jgi:dihydropteroate synthase